MGSSFEGILLRSSQFKDVNLVLALESILDRQTTGAEFIHCQLNSETHIIERTDNLFNIGSKVLDFAGELSADFGRSLYVEYNSTMGYKHSVYFENGLHIVSFGENDELLSPYDNDGNLSSELVMATKVEEGIEYEVVKNAIVLGLERLQSNSWDDLVGYIFSQR